LFSSKVVSPKSSSVERRAQTTLLVLFLSFFLSWRLLGLPPAVAWVFSVAMMMMILIEKKKRS
tara:strand:+ start:1556 stop:1744 length:189 start_codon:yes stop_codon:yes gene_type:complete